MAQSQLSETVDSWIIQAMVASTYLVKLYRALGDDRQADTALRACGACEERAKRLGLQARIAELHAVFVANHPEDSPGEAKAWQLLVEAQAGLSAFHGIVNDHEKGGSLRGNRTATAKALHKSMQGYRVAFPVEMASEGIQQAIVVATARCADTFVHDLEADGDSAQAKTELRQDLYQSILVALTQEALTTKS
jgi:hypothetical protein